MKYETFEELYRDNAALIECEFKGRFFEMFNKILAKIEWYQEKEHDHIDGGNCSLENDYYRKNIINLERIYKPLFNYVYDLPTELILSNKFPMIMAAKHSFVDASLPTEDEIIREFKGRTGLNSKLYKLHQKQMKLANILEGVIVWAYELGCKDLDKEPKDVYDEPENYERRRLQLSHLQSYAHNSCFAKMLAAIYDMGYNSAIRKNPDDFDGAAANALKEAQGFLENVFNKKE